MPLSTRQQQDEGKPGEFAGQESRLPQRAWSFLSPAGSNSEARVRVLLTGQRKVGLHIFAQSLGWGSFQCRAAPPGIPSTKLKSF